MNIYKTKSGEYINMDMVQYIDAIDKDAVSIWFEQLDKIDLYADEALAFLNYLDNRLDGMQV